MSTYNRGKFAVCLTLDGTYTEYEAKSINSTFESLASSDSGRTDDGVMHIDWVKNKYRKYTITMPPMKASEMASSATNPLILVLGRKYWIKVYDATVAGANADYNVPAIHVYTSNSQAECYSGVLYNGLWQGVSFTAIEMDGVKYS